MPELPEVETVVRSLKQTCLNGVITKAQFFRKDLRDKIPVSTFKKVVVDQQIISIWRRSKYILIETKKGGVLFHLGMTGQILCLTTPKTVHPHTHLVFELTRDSETSYFHYVDPRRFGRISAIIGDGVDKHPFLSGLGREPLLGSGLGLYLWDKGKNSKKSIKALLMDNKVVVGIGNIYACESLFKAGVSPLRKSHEVTKQEYLRIAKKAKETLRLAIKSGGTTIRDFKNMKGKSGYFAVSLLVYGKEDQLCTQCGDKIINIRQHGRTTWYCKVCQK